MSLPVSVDKRAEYVLCAAIHYKDGKTYEFQPFNIESGVVISGWRHHNCIITASQIFGDQYDKTLIGPDGQGFLTSHNRFIGRKEAYRIAKEKDQIWHNLIEDKPDAILASEDLYYLSQEHQ